MYLLLAFSLGLFGVFGGFSGIYLHEKYYYFILLMFSDSIFQILIAIWVGFRHLVIDFRVTGHLLTYTYHAHNTMLF